MENKFIYLDNAATTIPNKEVVALYNELECNFFGNPSSIHKLGIQSSSFLNKARESILHSLNLKNYKVYFTGSSTEANNLAIKGYAHKYFERGKHIITSKVEHASVLESFKALENEGFEVTYLDVDENGIIKIDDLKKALNNKTILVSLMAVNNEVGSINPIKEIAKLVHQYSKANLHVDTTQAIGKIDFDFNDADMFVISSHKIHGLKGSGALIARNNISLEPLISGGGQEEGIRSGTSSIALDCSLAKALKLEMSLNNNNVISLKKYLLSELAKIKEIEINTPVNSSPFIINFSLLKKKAAVVVEGLSNKGIYVSSVSACNSKKEAISHVVLAMKKDENKAHNTIRISLDYSTTREDIDTFLKEFKNILENIK